MKEVDYQGPTLEQELKKKERSKGSAAIPAVRTFRADVDALMKKEATTKTQIVMAEAARREARGESRTVGGESSHLGQIIFILTLMLAFVIGVGAYAILGTKINIPFLSGANKSATTTPEVTTKEAQILLSDSPREQILADVSILFGKTILASGDTRKVIFLINDASGKAREATAQEFLATIPERAPSDELLRSLDTSFTFNIFSGAKLTGGFVFTSRSYDNTFAAILDWEKTMSQDLLPIIHPEIKRSDLKGLRDRPFKDMRIGNLDVRTLSDMEGNIILMYALPDKQHLIISGSPEVFTAQSAMLTR